MAALTAQSRFFSEDHEIFREQVRNFVNKELVPHIDQWEQEGLFPKSLYRRMGELGFLGIRYPEKYGGSNGDIWMTVAFCEEMCRCRAMGLPMSVLVHTDMSSTHIARYGTEEQRQRYLVPMIKGEKVCAIGVSEPAAGSDVAGMQTTAVRDGDAYVLNGSKIFITNAVHADVFCVAAKTQKDKGHRGISMFIVERDTPGFRLAKKLQKLGNHSSDTGELVFEDVRIPRQNLIGEEGKGFYYIMGNFQDERLIAASMAVGAAQQALEDTLRYTRERRTFGQRLFDHQVIAHRLADLATELEAARQLTYYAADVLNRGGDCSTEVSMAKLFASEVANRIAYHCLQLHGGYGYIEEFPIERFFRDIRLSPIGGGTSEIMREIIAKRGLDRD
ncbi:MAG TPA: acyl-CoA dehydrogenase family protein [Candidatus Binatia bacterium]|nr:acyl-CoA dehydrogenase family protein [Candidatus Binatia bacterium]